jgi:hypothetical protein
MLSDARAEPGFCAGATEGRYGQYHLRFLSESWVFGHWPRVH